MLYRVVAHSVASEVGTVLLIELSWLEEGFVCTCPWPKDREPYETLFKHTAYLNKALFKTCKNNI